MRIERLPAEGEVEAGELASHAIELWTLQPSASRNALTRPMIDEISAQINRADLDPSLRCVILSGEGDKAFCAGADLKERAGMDETEVGSWLTALGRMLRALEQSPKIFIAALNGVALGGGFELALACDLRLAHSQVELALPEVTLGIIPGGGGTQRLSRAVGGARAKDLILTGRRLSATEAANWGLLNLVQKDLRQESIALARQVSKSGPIALRQAKRAIDEGIGLSLDSGLKLEQTLYRDCLESQDRLEALQAFAQKRRPRFSGK